MCGRRDCAECFPGFQNCKGESDIARWLWWMDWWQTLRTGSTNTLFALHSINSVYKRWLVSFRVWRRRVGRKSLFLAGYAIRGDLGFAGSGVFFWPLFYLETCTILFHKMIGILYSLFWFLSVLTGEWEWYKQTIVHRSVHYCPALEQTIWIKNFTVDWMGNVIDIFTAAVCWISVVCLYISFSCLCLSSTSISLPFPVLSSHFDSSIARHDKNKSHSKARCLSGAQKISLLMQSFLRIWRNWGKPTWSNRRTNHWQTQILHQRQGSDQKDLRPGARLSVQDQQAPSLEWSATRGHEW